MSLIIGIDVGGTHTNAVLIQDNLLLATAKCPTDPDDLLCSAHSVLEEITRAIPGAFRENIELHLSTTLATNAIVTGRGDPVATIVIPGPGVNPADLKLPAPVHEVKGAVDHRGRETAALDRTEIRRVLHTIRKSGIAALAIVGKFSVRNPSQELTVAAMAREEFPHFNPVILGHRLSGRLNFPRRITTAFLNAGIFRIQAGFGKMVTDLAEQYRVGKRIFLLKGDGGTIPLGESLTRPVETALSGPAASIMGALALGSPLGGTVVTLDIGGTTTEIAVLVNGEPLGEREGAVIAGYRTLIPALFSRSVGMGGDSRIYWSEGDLMIGPERYGPPAALGGAELTPTDAVVALGGASLGDRERAREGLRSFGAVAGLSVAETAERIVAVFVGRVVAAIHGVFEYLNSRPVYTVSEALTPANLRPERLVGMGGPADFWIPKIAARMGLPWQVLPYAEAANAAGAAASRPTVGIHLRADTELGKLIVPELDELTDLRRTLLFDMNKAREIAREKAVLYASRNGLDTEFAAIEITDEAVFNVVKDFYKAGQIFSLQAQIKPGVTGLKPGAARKEGFPNG
jgi:N-methylhydantoinase A